jgi:DNA-binding NarL/FixJ family response regulator
MIQVAIVDDKQLNRTLLQEQLSMSPKLEILFTAKDGAEFLKKMETANQAGSLPQVVLMDIEMPEMDGIEAVYRTHILYPDVAFLMLTAFDDDARIFDAIKAGAVGYLLKGETRQAIIEAIEEVVLHGGAPLSAIVAHKVLRLMSGGQRPTAATTPREDSGLSEREVDILRLVVQGFDYKIIGERLFISPHTVRTHIRTIYKKLNVHSKGEAVTLAHRKGLV